VQRFSTHSTLNPAREHPGPLLAGVRSERITGAVLRAGLLTTTLLAALCTSGCLRRDGRNSDCRWPAETVPHSATAWHLGEDAEFAEDLAIRYADAHHGLRTPYYRSGEAYASARDNCMAALFAQVATEHSVPVEQIFGGLGHSRKYLDLAEALPFALFYCLMSVAVARRIVKRYPFADGWIPGLLVMSLISAGFAIGGFMLGEVWSWLIEGYRMGNPHMSYRAQRLLWSRHPSAALASAFVLFWLSAISARWWNKRFSSPVA
jgi:hypothetical protein